MSTPKAPELDMEQLPGWFARNWPKVRQAFLIGSVAAGFVISFLTWWRETFPQPATDEQMEERLNDLKAETAQLTTLMMHETLRQYDDSLQAVAGRMTDSVAIPMLERQADLLNRMVRVEQQLGLARNAMEHTARTTEHTMQEIVDRVAGNNTDDKLDIILRELQRVKDNQRDINTRQERIEDRLMKTTKGKF